MHQITIKSPRRRKPIAVSIPESFEEVTDKQFTKVLPFLLNEEVDEDTRKRWITYYMLGLKPTVFNSLRLQLHNILDIYEECLPWITENSHVQIIKKFTHKGTEYHTMPSRFSVPILEIVYMDQHFEEIKAGDNAAIDKLVAVICRPQKENISKEDFTGDYREKFNEVYIEERAKLFEDLPFSTKMAVVLQYLGGKSYIMEEYSRVFAPVRDGGKKEVSPMPQYLKLIFDLAKQGTFGDWDKTAYTNIHVILFHLLNEKIESSNKKKGKR